MRRVRLILVVMWSFALSLLTSCASRESVPSPRVSITIDPKVASLVPCGTQTFSVAVTGAKHPSVTWTTTGGTVGSSTGNVDAFVRKYDADGAVVWTRQFGRAGNDGAYCVAADTDGNVLVSGATYGDVQGHNAGLNDAFVVKYSADGDLLWMRQFGTNHQNGASGVAADSGGNVVVVGSADPALGGGATGSTAPFLRKYDANGDPTWTRQFDSAGSAVVKGVAVDGSGNVLVAGYTYGLLGDRRAGEDDAFVRKYDASGTILWARQFVPSNVDHAEAW